MARLHSTGVRSASTNKGVSMICALTVRTLKPGTFDQFRDAFTEGTTPENMPEGWIRFNMVRNVENPDEVVCFGMFEGTVEDLRGQGQEGYEEQLARIAPFVASVGTDALFDVVEDQAA